ncbi:class I SAM-dependent methyltransferase [Poritiphilus flavus]|uniref:Methyltransferase domain-containing protein n=1 Tax=Poritiphilus flavus TaxID=2697053 RepID=A0A6L9E8A6_9FLAO|nr:class I SAM-dependent methyltransferase [Poritiphilus flavus]NAS10997.1 methyltransferase domain-containing protein [Poritiphilus flavus]
MKLYLKTKDHAFSGESFELMIREDLDILETRPVPEDIDRYYEAEDYISHSDSRETLVDRIYQIVKKHNLRRKVRLLDSLLTEPKSLLDYGAGTGDFLLLAREASWKVSGIEPNARARENARQKGMDLRANLNEISSGSFDVITLWHVLEHLPDLQKAISAIKELLRDDGYLVVAVPNFKAWDARRYKEFWAAYDVPRHLWHFSRDGIEQLFSQQGMKLHQTKPMYFDAFYVSLLSERYKKSRFALLKGFWSGLRSNLSAMRTGEYSSLIYVLQKA